MAQLLYRLGLGAARRPFTVLIAWLLALALAVGGFLAFGGTLSTAVDIPGTPTAQVTDRLKEEFPDASHGTGQVVFATEDGSALTPEQRSAVSGLLEGVRGQQAVADVVDPFDVQTQQEDARTRLADGRRQIEDGEQGLVDGRAQIDDGRAQLADAEQKADEGEEQLADAARRLLDLLAR